MRIHAFKITVVGNPRPSHSNLNYNLQWLGNSLGLFSLRDKDKSCFRIFVELVKSAKTHHPMSSDEIAYKLNLSRGTVIHHIHRLLDCGIVISHMNKYMLRVDNLKDIIDKIQNDFNNTFDELRDVAKDIDKHIGLE